MDRNTHKCILCKELFWDHQLLKQHRLSLGNKQYRCMTQTELAQQCEKTKSGVWVLK